MKNISRWWTPCSPRSSRSRNKKNSRQEGFPRPAVSLRVPPPQPAGEPRRYTALLACMLPPSGEVASSASRWGNCLSLEGKVANAVGRMRWTYLPLISLLRRQLSAPPSVGCADISLRRRESSPRGKPFLPFPTRRKGGACSSRTVPLPFREKLPQALTEGENTDALRDPKISLSLSLRSFALSIPRRPITKRIAPSPAESFRRGWCYFIYVIY